jgi:alkaline phosphatase D
MSVTHGVAVAEVTATSAVILARANRPGWLHVEVIGRRILRARPARATAASDLIAKVAVRRLRPGTRYRYRVWFSTSRRKRRAGASKRIAGSFVSALAARQEKAVRFVVGSDLGGQQYCRDAGRGGYAILAAIARASPDFYVAAGDHIYADNTCPAAGADGRRNIPGNFVGIDTLSWTDRAALREQFRRHWRYNRADPFQQRLLRATSLYAQWDDHEVVNDFGAAWDRWHTGTAGRAGYGNVVAEGLAAFRLWNAVPARMYRSFRWGRDLELFLLDNRSFRSRNDLPDGPGKTMLGGAQLAWLKAGLRRSTATWKVVAAAAPLSVPAGSDTARDGWASGGGPTGFEHELRDLLADLDAANVRNIVFANAGPHTAYVFEYRPDANGDGDPLVFHEFVTGPLSADRFPPRSIDSTFGPRPLYAEGGLFNFAVVTVGRAADGRAHLVVETRDENGVVRPTSRIDLVPQ